MVDAESMTQKEMMLIIMAVPGTVLLIILSPNNADNWHFNIDYYLNEILIYY